MTNKALNEKDVREESVSYSHKPHATSTLNTPEGQKQHYQRLYFHSKQISPFVEMTGYYLAL